jgi:hypothetical protein
MVVKEKREAMNEICWAKSPERCEGQTEARVKLGASPAVRSVGHTYVNLVISISKFVAHTYIVTYIGRQRCARHTMKILAHKTVAQSIFLHYHFQTQILAVFYCMHYCFIYFIFICSS